MVQILKKFTLMLTLFIVNCSLFGDTTDYEISWDIPTETDLKSLHIYKWEGKDTTLCPFFNNIPLFITDSLFLKSVDPYSGDNLFSGIADGDSTYISVMGQYQDIGGLYSGTVWAEVWKDGVLTSSHFMLSKNLNPPSNPTGLQGITLTLNRKAEVKKSTPFVLKVWGYMLVTWFVAWSFCHYVVNYYNPGAYPDISVIKMLLDFWKELGVIGVTGLIIPAILEIFRKR